MAGTGSSASAGARAGGSCWREYRSISSRSIVPIVAYIRMNAIRLIQIQVVDTVGEIPFLVSMMPCTIHGWRPDSVRNQPAVFSRNGSTTDHTATHRNSRDVASVFRRISHNPHTEMRKTTTAREAITRMAQYWMNTFGT